MIDFAYSRATDVAGVLRELAAGQRVKPIAGGTNLVDLMKENVERPDHVIDITRLPLRGIKAGPEGGLRIGALTSNADVAYDEQVQRYYPLLSKALLAGASAQIRNMASVGGNLMQRTRCSYFYDRATPCNKREPGTGCSALHGFNKGHAILGASEHCIATHPSDMCVALAALEAVVNVTGGSGERSIALADFHRLPGDRPDIDTTLRPDELITSVDLPAQGFAEHHAYLKIRERTSYAFALVSVAAALELDGERIVRARLALGSVAHKPWRRREAEVLLEGKPPSHDNFVQAAQEMVRGARGYGHNEFKVELARRAVVRALQSALDRR